MTLSPSHSLSRGPFIALKYQKCIITEMERKMRLISIAIKFNSSQILIISLSVPAVVSIKMSDWFKREAIKSKTRTPTSFSH